MQEIFDSDHALASALTAQVEEKHAAQISAMMQQQPASVVECALRTPYNSFMYYYSRAAGLSSKDRHVVGRCRLTPSCCS